MFFTGEASGEEDALGSGSDGEGDDDELTEVGLTRSLRGMFLSRTNQWRHVKESFLLKGNFSAPRQQL